MLANTWEQNCCFCLLCSVLGDWATVSDIRSTKSKDKTWLKKASEVNDIDHKAMNVLANCYGAPQGKAVFLEIVARFETRLYRYLWGEAVPGIASFASAAHVLQQLEEEATAACESTGDAPIPKHVARVCSEGGPWIFFRTGWFFWLLV